MEAWVLNLDAEMEMARPRGYTPSVRVAEEARRAAASLRGLLPPGSVVVRRGEPPPPGASGAVGRAWCPTPSAARALRAAGAIPEAVPPFDVVRRVNSRAFCATLGQGLPGAALAETLPDALVTLARPTASGTWLAKRPFALAGRGRRKLGVGLPSEPDRLWIEASLRTGPLQIEPWVPVETELVVHGLLAASGDLDLGVPCVQHVDAHGAFRGAERADAGALPAGVGAALSAEGERVGRALFEAGYFGPFGVDAYLYREGGALRFLPRSEINARYTMAWAVGMGRPA